MIRVLLIEDNSGDARLIKELLAEAKGGQFRVQHAGRLSEGLDRLGGGGIDAVLLDLSLPDSVGLDSLDRLRAHVSHIPIVVLTGLEDEELASRAVRQGAQDYLSKGRIDADLLSRSLRYAIDRQGADNEQERLLAEVQRRAAELEGVIESIADGIFIFGPQAEILRMNRAAEAMLGVTREQYRRPIEERVRPLRMETVEGKPLTVEEAPTYRAARGETVKGMVIVYRTPDGRTLWGSTSSVPMRAADGRMLGVVTTLTDVTELHELQEQREDLVRMVSHDLRSPLTAVQGQAQLLSRQLRRSGQNGRLVQSAEAIVTGAKRMNAMIQDLVDMARVESRQLALARASVELRPFVFDLKQRLAGVLDTARLRMAIPEKLPPVWADPNRLERILTNLLSNALKYSDPETEVVVTAEGVGEAVEISVIDRGVGISDEDLPHIFDRFYRAKRARKATGLGLGLYITRMLVEAHGGQIRAESEPGKGSTFFFSLPSAQG